ncbi:MAG: DNA repair protein RadA, partial [Clostridia bacterium]|nr:DNA repair protein RadA [Clostridia bacterium]
MKASKSVFICTECEYKATKWMGKCPSCGAWNTMEEQEDYTPDAPSKASARHALFS